MLARVSPIAVVVDGPKRAPEEEQVPGPDALIPEVALGRSELAECWAPTWNTPAYTSLEIWVEVRAVVAPMLSTGEFGNQLPEIVTTPRQILVVDWRMPVWNRQ